MPVSKHPARMGGTIPDSAGLPDIYRSSNRFQAEIFAKLADNNLILLNLFLQYSNFVNSVSLRLNGNSVIISLCHEIQEYHMVQV